MPFHFIKKMDINMWGLEKITIKIAQEERTD